MVFSSAISPWIFGLLFDAGLGIIEISYLGAGIILITAILAKFAQPQKMSRKI